MVKLQWLQVNKFRSVKPGTRLTFNPGHNVLLGQNGTGKTTLLNLVAAVIKSDFADLKDEEFDLSYQLATDRATATLLVRSEHRPLPMPSLPEGISGVMTPEGVLRTSALFAFVSISDKQTGLEVALEIKGTRGSSRRIDKQAPSQDFDLDFSDAEGWPLWALFASGLRKWASMSATEINNELFDLFFEFSTARFDESLEYFNDLGNLHIELVRYADGHISFGGNNGSVHLAKHLTSLAQKQWATNRYVLTDVELPFLKEAVRLLDFESAEAIFELKSSSRHTDIENMRLGNPRFYFRHRGGWKISEKLLSYGQKRMLAFLHYLDTAKSTVIADELVNGLHHRWIRACFEALGQRQVFLTSQNPLLLDYLGFQSPEDVRSTFVLCRWETGPEQMAWENMTQEAARDFFDSYKVGFQQVGELLQSKGLW